MPHVASLLNSLVFCLMWHHGVVLGFLSGTVIKKQRQTGQALFAGSTIFGHHGANETMLVPDPLVGISVSSSEALSTEYRRSTREEQIERLQGFWWGLNNKGKDRQLFEIKSSYAIFHCITNNSPSVMYPLGGTDHVVTLRTCKLVDITPAPIWSSSPVSGSQGRVLWRKCNDDDCRQLLLGTNLRMVPGYEQTSLSKLPAWSASPVDVTQDYFQKLGIKEWTIKKCHYFSQDVCSLHVYIENRGMLVHVGLTRNHDKESSKVDPTWIKSTVDFELAVHSRVWGVDVIKSLPPCCQSKSKK